MKNKITLSFILLITLLSSCSKTALDLGSEGTPTPASFWKTETDIKSASNSLYEVFDGEEFYGRGFMWYINASDDMVVGRSKAQAYNIKNFDPATKSAGYMSSQWQDRFQTIKRANDILKYAPNIKMTDAARNLYLGEAYFIRSVMYYELAYTYGNSKAGIPIQSQDNIVASPLREANVTSNYNYIVTDLSKTAEMLPYFNELSPADYGRPHKTAAWAYLSKVYLIMKDYANAEKYASMVINSGKHSLMPNFVDVFKIANNWGPEYIWSCVSSINGGSILPGVMLENKGWGKYNGWGYYQPTKELYDSYQPGDKRRSATILKIGDKFKFFGDSVIYPIGGITNSLTGFQFNKYMEPFSYSNPIGVTINTNGDHPTTSLNVPLLRYAEVILIKAEAELMQGKSADNEINLIRNRAGLPSITGSTMVDLKQERRCELAGELSNRHFDLVRWGDAKSIYSLPLHGIDGKEVWPARNFNPEIHNVWPVPQSVIDASNQVITQNQGW